MPKLVEIIDFLDSIEVLDDQVDDELLHDLHKNDFRNYRFFHAKRLWRSLELIHDQITPYESIRILELGAMPYYFTALLLHYIDCEAVVGANIRGKVWPFVEGNEDQPRVVRLRFGSDAQTREIEIHVLNIERDTFPFPDSSFDLVFCMDVIEHLIYSPTHMLTETHRVLKPSGKLFLTTPNAISMLKTLSLILNRPIGFPYSGYSVYGRHNREFTEGELLQLLSACGFKVLASRLENITLRRHYPLIQKSIYKLIDFTTGLPLPYLKTKRDYILITAECVGQPISAFPKNLYLFRHLYGSHSNDAD